MNAKSKISLACLSVVLAIFVVTPNYSFCYEWTWPNPLPQINDLNAVWGSSATDIFAVGRDDTILHFDGSTWSPMKSGTTNCIFSDVWGTSPTDVFAVGTVDTTSGIILHYNGSDWSAMLTPSTIYFGSVWGSSAADVFAVGGDNSGSAIFHYNGNTWSKMTANLAGNETLYDVWGSSATDVFFSVGQSSILHYDGSTWAEMTIPTIPVGLWVLEGIWGSSATDVFAVGGNEYYRIILHYDGGIWSEMTREPGRYLIDVWGSSPNNVFAVGPAGTILHYDGSTWSKMTTPTTNHLIGVWGSSATDVFAVGYNGTILHYGESVTTTTVPATTTTTPPISTTTTTTPKPPLCTAEAIYGENSVQTELLREYRDTVLSKTPEGQEIIKTYYKISPMVTKLLEQNPLLKDRAKAYINSMLPGIRKKVEESNKQP
jgi:hypothetical protein